MSYSAYIVGPTGYKQLNPTGRWKIESGPRYENALFIEHKGFLFRYWVNECWIVEGPAKKSVVFECGMQDEEAG